MSVISERRAPSFECAPFMILATEGCILNYRPEGISAQSRAVRLKRDER